MTTTTSISTDPPTAPAPPPPSPKSPPPCPTPSPLHQHYYRPLKPEIQPILLLFPSTFASQATPGLPNRQQSHRSGSSEEVHQSESHLSFTARTSKINAALVSEAMSPENYNPATGSSSDDRPAEFVESLSRYACPPAQPTVLHRQQPGVNPP